VPTPGGREKRERKKEEEKRAIDMF